MTSYPFADARYEIIRVDSWSEGTRPLTYDAGKMIR